MNDPFVVDQARKWADRLLAGTTSDDRARISRMVEAATGRLPDESALASLAGFLDEQTALYGARDGKDARAWADLAHALFNQKDSLYLR